MLTSKISGRSLFNAAILLGILLAQSCDGQSWAAFRRKHVDNPKTRAPNPNAYCNLMMQRRNLMERPCIPTNTFINYNAASILQLCQNMRRGYVNSRQSFHVIVCRRRANAQFPNCQYTGRPQKRRIRVKCDRYVPIRLGNPV